jgi:HAD superfamily hydrolase (TIGR01509 family)
MAKTRIDTVVFDLGGVLVQIARGWDDAYRLAGFDADHPALASETFRQDRLGLANAHQRGEITPEQWAASIAETSEGAYSAEDAMRVMDAWIIEEYPGIAEVIDTIHDAGLATAALSNTNARHWELLGAASGDFANYPTLERLGQLHASHILGQIKPDIEIYDAFTEAAGLNGSSVLFFDDTMPNIEAARRYGWSARHIDSANDPPRQMMATLRHHRIID